MDVAVDTNVLAKDLWLRSQSVRALLDYLERTRSRLLVHDVVYKELSALYERQCAEAVRVVETATRHAARFGVEGLPQPDQLDSLRRQAVARWRGRVADVLSPAVRADVPLDSAVLPEVITRTIGRIAPCTQSDKEFRDAVIWLGLLRHAAEAMGGAPLAFISENTKQFAADGGVGLHPTLAHDVAAHGVELTYFASLDDFLREHARPIAHITTEWVEPRLDAEALTTLVADYAGAIDGDWLGEIGEGWIPDESARILDVEATLEDVYVWRYAEGVVGLFLGLEAVLDGEVYCRRTGGGYRFRDGDSDSGERYRSKSFQRERRIRVAAEVIGDRLSLIGIEDWFAG